MQSEDIDEVDEDKDEKPQKHNRSLLVLMVVFLIAFAFVNLTGAGLTSGPVWTCKNPVLFILLELSAMSIAVQMTLVCVSIYAFIVYFCWGGIKYVVSLVLQNQPK